MFDGGAGSVAEGGGGMRMGPGMWRNGSGSVYACRCGYKVVAWDEDRVLCCVRSIYLKCSW